MADAELESLADEEILAAVALPWRDLAKITPWGDSFGGVTSSGRFVTFERNYLWATEEGGDVLVEVVVFVSPEHYDAGARRSRTIRRPG